MNLIQGVLRAAATGAALTFIGCHESKGPALAPAGALEPGVQILILSAQVPSSVTVPISGIKIGVVLPPGVLVPMVAGSTLVQASVLTPMAHGGAAILASGNYRTGTRTLEVDLVDSAKAPWTGDYLTVQFTVAPGAVVTLAGIQALNKAPAIYKVTGIDLATHTSVDLTSEVTTAIALNPSAIQPVSGRKPVDAE